MKHPGKFVGLPVDHAVTKKGFRCWLTKNWQAIYTYLRIKSSTWGTGSRQITNWFIFHSFLKKWWEQFSVWPFTIDNEPLFFWTKVHLGSFVKWKMGHWSFIEVSRSFVVTKFRKKTSYETSYPYTTRIQVLTIVR